MRAKARKAKKLVKEAEMVRKREEIKQLKTAKRRELEGKLKQISDITGLNSLQSLNARTLLSQWDSSKHDELMSQLFNDDFYDAEEEADEEFIKSIAQDDDDKEDDIIKPCKFARKMGNKQFGHTTKKDVVSQKVSDTLNKHVKEMYSLDYEDLLGDLRVRFKYRQVEPADFGMSIDDILTEDDKQLNKKASLKRITKVYKDDNKRIDQQSKSHQQRRNNKTNKSSSAPVTSNQSTDIQSSESKKTRRRQKPKSKRFDLNKQNQLHSN